MRLTRSAANVFAGGAVGLLTSDPSGGVGPGQTPGRRGSRPIQIGRVRGGVGEGEGEGTLVSSSDSAFVLFFLLFLTMAAVPEDAADGGGFSR